MSYADLAVRLVNTAARADDEPDQLGTAESFRVLAADFASLAGPVTRYDLEALRQLRAELSVIFAAAAGGSQRAAADRLNALLIQHPVHPELVRHDNERWHVHLAGTGSVTGRYAAGAVFGLTLFVAQFGADRLGMCAIASCSRVFLDSSTNRSRRYCGEHGAARANVTAIEPGRRAGTDGPAAHAAS
ncbi:MAG TPA: CGNR zinc finger domain-containing protein [Streptosporangiaceae bacterium]|nr:CGNR zinc finger domain-containing protein [Streptosporangiaceae bacterium]